LFEPEAENYYARKRKLYADTYPDLAMPIWRQLFGDGAPGASRPRPTCADGGAR
jgi:hypothetical protein